MAITVQIVINTHALKYASKKPADTVDKHLLDGYSKKNDILKLTILVGSIHSLNMSSKRISGQYSCIYTSPYIFVNDTHIPTDKFSLWRHIYR